MKKFIAAALCLTLSAPCFAADKYRHHYPISKPQIEHRNDVYPPSGKPCSLTAKTLAAAAGAGVAAAIISSVID